MRKLCFCLYLYLTKIFILGAVSLLKYNLTHFINIPISAQCTPLTYSRIHVHITFFIVYFSSASQPHIIFIFSFFYSFFIYIFGAASKQISLYYCVKSYMRFIVCVATRKRMLGNVIQHDDQRQIVLLCKNMNKIPFVWANSREAV